METELNLEVTAAELVQIVQSVFETMLNLETRTCATPWFPSTNHIIAAVHLAGAWNGAVLIECDRDRACQFAGRFLSIDTPSSVDDDVRDVLGELANMIGGNLKCVLMPGIQLSMPSVVDGSDYSMRFCGTAIRERISFECSDGPFWVTVMGSSC